MWNKLFKKKKQKQSKVSNKSSEAESVSDAKKKKHQPATSTKCFSFRNAKKAALASGGDHYALSNDNFSYFQYESEVYRKPDFDGMRIYQPEQHQQPDENQTLNEIFIEIPPPNLRLDLCPVCSRKFAPETLMKHVIICEKINTKKRKPFDSSRQRLNGTEFVVGSGPPPPTTPGSIRSQAFKFETRASPPKTLQRKASVTSLKSQPGTSSSSSYYERRNLLDSMSRKNSTISLSGTPRPTLSRRNVAPPPQSEKCPYCDRTFGFKAFDRHVEWCKEKSLIKANPDCAIVSAAKERMKTRINYKAPCLKTKRTATREKYSNSCNGSTNSLADFDSILNSMSSSMTSENGLYDPFLSAKKQLEELFSPTTAATPSTQMINSMMTPTAATTPSISSKKTNDIMSKSLTLNNNNYLANNNNIIASPKTPQPIPKQQSNFRRTSSLRISNRKPKPVYTPPVRSNIHCGITDDGPISPNFVKATDYDELPIKSPYSAIKLQEMQQQIPTRASPSPTAMPAIISSKPMLRDKISGLGLRKNLKLDLKNTNLPSADYPLSKTDSLALFLKYEHDLARQLSEKDLKDQSNNSLSKRTSNQNGSAFMNAEKDHNKLPDINGKTLLQKSPPLSNGSIKSNDKPLISIDNLKQSRDENDSNKIQSAPVKLSNACDNLPLLSSSSDQSRSPSLDRKADDDSADKISQGSRSTLRRRMKYSKDNFLFDTDPSDGGNKSQSPSSSDTSNNNSLIRPESQESNTGSIFEEFDFDQFIASFNDDEQFPIFKDYKMQQMNNKPTKSDDDNNNFNVTAPSVTNSNAKPSNTSNNNIIKNLDHSKPIPILQQQPQQQKKSESEMSGMEKLDNLCKMLSGNSDSDESNSLETDPSDAQMLRSKSSADSGFGRQSQSPLDYRKMSSNGQNFRPTPPPPPIRQHLELKTTEIVLNPIKAPNYQETIMIPKNPPTISRMNSTEQYSKFCHDCGYKFVVPTAKFCIECGVRRIKL